MPYIPFERRAALLTTAQPSTPGELNYVITREILSYWQSGVQCYQVLNDIIGALESAKAEFQRRVVAPYEDSAAKRNGDLPGYALPGN